MVRSPTSWAVAAATFSIFCHSCSHGAPQGGSLLADVVVVPMLRGTVTNMLPSEVALGPELDGMENIPVTFAFSVHSNHCNDADDKSWLDGRSYDLNYNEFSLTVPSVCFSNPKPGQETNSFSFVPRTYLDDRLTMLLGWALTAVDKAQAQMNHTDDVWSVSDFDTDELMLSLNITDSSEWLPYSSLPSDSPAKLSVPDFLAAPLLGNAQGPPGIPAMFPMCLDRAVALQNASVQPLGGVLAVHKQLDVLPSLEYGFNSSTGFRLLANWTSSMPNNCSNVKPFQTAANSDVFAALPLPLPFSGVSSAPQHHSRQADPVCTHPPGAGGGGGAYLADFVVSMMRTKVVEKMLPEGVRLPLALRIVPTTPVIFVFGYQYGVCDNSDSKAWLDGRSFILNYNEFIMAIPDVELSNPPPGQSSGSHTFQPRLFLDEPEPMALGWGFGIDKVLAQFDHDPSVGHWSVKDWDTQEEILALETKNTSGWLPMPSFSPDSFVGLLATGLGGGDVGTPILGVSGRGYKGDPHGQGYFVCGVISFDLADHAEVQLIRGKMHVRKPLDNGHFMKAFDTTFLTGVRLRSNWTMSFPNDCSHSSEPGDARGAWVKLRDMLLAEGSDDVLV